MQTNFQISCPPVINYKIKFTILQTKFFFPNNQKIYLINELFFFSYNLKKYIYLE